MNTMVYDTPLLFIVSNYKGILPELNSDSYIQPLLNIVAPSYFRRNLRCY